MVAAREGCLGVGEMAQRQGESLEAARELAELLRDNVELCARELERSYVREYPNSQANRLPRAPIMDWARSAVLDMAASLETGDPSALTYPHMPGDAVVDPHERLLSRLINCVSTLFFYGRHLGPVVYQLSLADQGTAMRMLTELESLIERAVTLNFELFRQSACKPGDLVSTWDLMAPLSAAMSGPAPSAAPDRPGEPQPAPHASETVPSHAPAAPSRPVQANALSATQVLSPRELDVLNLVVAGKTNGEIAATLGVSQNTVKNHMAHIFDKLNVNTRAGLVAKVLAVGTKTSR